MARCSYSTTGDNRVKAYLSPQLFHQRLQFTEKVVTLMEEGQVGVHEGQHLRRGTDQSEMMSDMRQEM